MDFREIFIQLIGYVGLVFAVVAFQCKSHKRVMIWRTLNELFFAVQYVFLASYTGAAMNVVGSVRNMGFAHRVENGKSTLPLQLLFSVIFLISGILTYNGYVSIMVIGAKIVSTVAYGMKNTKYIRLLTLITSSCWLVYNASCASWAGVLCEIFTLLSIISAIIRIDIVGRIREGKSGKKLCA